MNKPKCAVKGMLRPGAMCGHVIVGGVFCGHKGECQHKVQASGASAAHIGQMKVSGAGTASVGLPG